ncbi:MAG: YhgE/Pip family protein [Acutalibacteraceae bacterium]
MKTIFAVFKNDLKKIFSSVIVFIVVIGLSVLPALYAWFNIASNWNPYDNSGNIDVAVVNLDKGCKIGALKTSFGDVIVDNLKKNTQMGWKFVDKDTANQGIINGDYYAAVIISEDFSKNLVSITSGKLVQPEITYLVNEKKNAIAPKITDKGIQAIQTEVNSSFVAEITNIAATVLDVSSDKITESKDEICDKIISALDDGKTSLDSLKSTINVISGSMDSINYFIKSNKDSLPELKKNLNETSDLIDSIKNASTAIKSASNGLSTTFESTITSVDSLVSSFGNQLNTVITKINNGSKNVAGELQNLTEISNKIIDVNNDLIKILNNLNNSGSSGATGLISTIDGYISKISSFTDSLSKKTNTIFDTIEKDTSSASDKLNEITLINQNIIDTNNQLISSLNYVSEKLGIDTSATVSKLKTINEKQNAIINKINNAAAKIKETGAAPKDLKSDIDALIKETENFSAQIKTEISTIVSDIKSDFKVSDIVEFLTGINTDQQKIIGKINSAVNTLKDSDVLPADFESEIKALSDSAKSSVAKFKNNYLTPAKNAIEKLVSQSGNALDKISDVLTSSAITSEVEEALNSAQKIISSLNSTFTDVKKLIDKGIKNLDNIKENIKNLKENSSVENLINTVFGDPEAVSNFISSPVKINTEKVFPVKDYGSAMAPFYTVLALWVGGIVLVAVLKPELSKKDIKKIGSVKPYQEYFGRYLIFMVISLVQATIVALGDIFFLRIQCDNFFLFMLTIWITIIVFSLLIYSLTISFNVIGKAVAVIILIIQVAGSGGTFPPELLPEFFRAIIRFMPFNYAINAIRETIAGVTYSAYWKNILYLLCFIPVALIIGILLRKPCMKIMKFFNKKLEETDLIV